MRRKRPLCGPQFPYVGNCLASSASVFLPAQKPLTPEATHKTYIKVNLLAEMRPFLVRHIRLGRFWKNINKTETFP